MDLRQRAETYLGQALDAPAASFRDGQWEAIRALIEDRAQVLVVQRTGWGKSMVYFIATRLLRDQGRGPTLLVSPLLALMRNQIEAAERLGLRAVTINPRRATSGTPPKSTCCVTRSTCCSSRRNGCATSDSGTTSSPRSPGASASSSSTRRTASPTGATTSVPTTDAS